MGVNREKDPVDGTSPDKLLFDRSLHIHFSSHYERFPKENDTSRTLYASEQLTELGGS